MIQNKAWIAILIASLLLVGVASADFIKTTKGNYVYFELKDCSGILGYFRCMSDKEAVVLENPSVYQKLGATAKFWFTSTAEDRLKNPYWVKYYMIKEGSDAILEEAYIDGTTQGGKPFACAITTAGCGAINYNLYAFITLPSQPGTYKVCEKAYDYSKTEYWFQSCTSFTLSESTSECPFTIGCDPEYIVSSGAWGTKYAQNCWTINDADSVNCWKLQGLEYRVDCKDGYVASTDGLSCVSALTTCTLKYHCDSFWEEYTNTAAGKVEYQYCYTPNSTKSDCGLKSNYVFRATCNPGYVANADDTKCVKQESGPPGNKTCCAAATVISRTKDTFDCVTPKNTWDVCKWADTCSWPYSDAPDTRCGVAPPLPPPGGAGAGLKVSVLTNKSMGISIDSLTSSTGTDLLSSLCEKRDHCDSDSKCRSLKYLYTENFIMKEDAIDIFDAVKSDLEDFKRGAATAGKAVALSAPVAAAACAAGVVLSTATFGATVGAAIPVCAGAAATIVGGIGLEAGFLEWFYGEPSDKALQKVGFCILKEETKSPLSGVADFGRKLFGSNLKDGESLLYLGIGAFVLLFVILPLLMPKR